MIQLKVGDVVYQTDCRDIDPQPYVVIDDGYPGYDWQLLPLGLVNTLNTGEEALNAPLLEDAPGDIFRDSHDLESGNKSTLHPLQRERVIECLKWARDIALREVQEYDDILALHGHNPTVRTDLTSERKLTIGEL